MVLVGIEVVNYKSKSTGNPVSGFRIHMTDDSERKGLTGMAVFSEFVPDDVGRSFLRNFTKDEEALGSVVTVRYNRWGRVDEIELN